MYLLRWRFEYKTRPPKCGMWGTPGRSPADMACFQQKEGLVSAKIEAKNIDTRETKILAESPGQDFVNFQWIAIAKVGSNEKSDIVGMKLVSRNLETEVFKDGTVRQNKKESKVNFATFGK